MMTFSHPRRSIKLKKTIDVFHAQANGLKVEKEENTHLNSTHTLLELFSFSNNDEKCDWYPYKTF